MTPLPHRGHRLLRAAPAAALALVLLGTPPVSAGPTEQLRDFFAAINTVLADPETEDKPLERVSRVRRLVGEVSTVNEAAALALGGEWQVRTAMERGEFVRLFAALLERAYVGRLAGRGRLSNGVRIAYLGESVAGDEATVETSLGARDGGEARIEYRMVNRQGRWRVRDVVLDGVSTVENYRAQFRRVLRQVSYQDLIEQVKAKLGDESSIFARAGGWSTPAPEPSLTELVLIARLDDAARDTDRQPPVVRAVPTVRSTEVGRSLGSTGTAPVPSAAPGPSYWVQVGAFKTAAAAGRLAERLDGGTVVASPSGRLQLVRVGPFAQRAQALSKLRELETLGHRPFIAEVRD